MVKNTLPQYLNKAAYGVSTWCRQSYSGPGGVALIWPGSRRSSVSPVLEHP